MIVLDVIGLRTWQPLSRTNKVDRLVASLSGTDLDKLDKEFAQWLLQLLKYQVRQAIKLQKFPRAYKPLSPDYKDFKQANNLKPGFWQATGFLSEELTVWQGTNGTWHIGWPPTLKHKASPDQLVADIARRLELGDKKRRLPPRPLFTPLAENIAKGIFRYFTTFVHQHHPEFFPLIDADSSQAPLTLTLKTPLMK